MADLGEAQFFNHEYGDIMYKRAVGELPEMESSKATARVLSDRISTDDSILDVGCAAGHYLRSLKDVTNVPFTYTGIDRMPMFTEVAEKAWSDDSRATFKVGDIYDLPFQDNEFDIVMCNNLLHHLPSIVGPITELIRVSRRLIVLRMLIGDRSFYIKEVHSQLWDGDSDVVPESEFHDDGQPVSYSYTNIYSREYVEGVIRRAQPNARITIQEDRFFDPAAIDDSQQLFKEETGRKGPTYMLGNHQVVGYVLQPYHFVIIEKS